MLDYWNSVYTLSTFKLTCLYEEFIQHRNKSWLDLLIYCAKCHWSELQAVGNGILLNSGGTHLVNTESQGFFRAPPWEVFCLLVWGFFGLLSNKFLVHHSPLREALLFQRLTHRRHLNQHNWQKHIQFHWSPSRPDSACLSEDVKRLKTRHLALEQTRSLATAFSVFILNLWNLCGAQLSGIRSQKILQKNLKNWTLGVLRNDIH